MHPRSISRTLSGVAVLLAVPVALASCSTDEAPADPTSTADGGPGGARADGPLGGEAGDPSRDGGAGDGGGDAIDPGARLTRARILYSGHSLMDNPLPDHVETIATGRGADLRWNQQNAIGSPLRVRTKGNDPNGSAWPGYSTGKNREGSGMNIPAELLAPQTLGPGDRYDTLVVTERHDLLGCLRWENTVGYARHYHDRLVAGNAAARTYLYHSWLTMNVSDPAPWVDYEKKALYAWECVASKVNDTLAVNGQPRRVATLPAGGALVALVERLTADTVPGITGTQAQRLGAVFTDGVHLTALGSYFVGAVTYASVFRDSPVGAPGPAGASAPTVTAMQQLAWDYVRAYYGAPNAGTHTMAECRAFIADNVCSGHYTLTGAPNEIANCRSWVSNANEAANPFRDEAPYTPLPWP